MQKKHLFYLCVIMLIGLFFRFYLIGKMPGGLFPDEAANGLDINNIFKGHIYPFYARGNGRESLFFFLQAISVALFGRGYWQHHIVSASIGTLSILVTYLFASRLISRRVGLLAAFLQATGTWAIVLSRTAFRANMIALFVPLCMYFAVCAIQAQEKKWKYIHGFLFGLAFAGGFYTYIAFRMMAFIMIAFVGILLIADYKQKFLWTKTYFKPALSAVVGFVIGFSWIGYYFLTHPGSFIGRSGQVSVFNSDLNHGDLLGTIISVFTKSVEAFFRNGDVNWRHNISGAAFLSPLISPFFGITLALTTFFAAIYFFKAFRGTQNNTHIKYLLLAGLFWGMLVPVVTTAEGIPHGLRSIGMLPTAYILSAIGLDYFARTAMKFWHPHWMEKLYKLVAILFFGSLIFIAYTQYFVYAYNSYENYDAFRSDLSVVSSYLNGHNDKAHTYLVLDLFSIQTVDYFTTLQDNPYIVVDPANAYKLHVSKGDTVVFTNSTIFDSKNFEKTHNNYTKQIWDANRFHSTDMIVYEINADDSSKSLGINSDHTFDVLNLGDRIDFSWKNISFDPWNIKIWMCNDPECKYQVQIKDNMQNDYLSTHDHIDIGPQPTNLYFHAIAYDQHKNVLKDFGIVTVQGYK